LLCQREKWNPNRAMKKEKKKVNKGTKKIFFFPSFHSSLLRLPLGLPPLFLSHKVVWSPGASLLFSNGRLGGSRGDLLLQGQGFAMFRPLTLELACLLPISSPLLLGKGGSRDFLEKESRGIMVRRRGRRRRENEERSNLSCTLLLLNLVRVN